MSKLTPLFEMARAARGHAYAPYSSCKVGAAILTADGRSYSGCNVENSSYGATVCAERIAIHKAVSEVGSVRITDIVVVTEATPPWPPCGMCRQVIAEFATPETMIHAANLSGIQQSMAFRDLFPHAFTPAHLGK